MDPTLFPPGVAVYARKYLSWYACPQAAALQVSTPRLRCCWHL